MLYKDLPQKQQQMITNEILKSYNISISNYLIIKPYPLINLKHNNTNIYLELGNSYDLSEANILSTTINLTQVASLSEGSPIVTLLKKIDESAPAFLIYYSREEYKDEVNIYYIQ